MPFPASCDFSPARVVGWPGIDQRDARRDWRMAVAMIPGRPRKFEIDVSPFRTPGYIMCGRGRFRRSV